MPSTESAVVVFINPSRSWGGAEKSSFSVAQRLGEKRQYRVIYRTAIPQSAIPGVFTKSVIEIGKIEASPWFPFKNPGKLFRDLLCMKDLVSGLCRQSRGPVVFFGVMHYASFLLSVVKIFSIKPFGLVSSPRGPLTPFLRHMVKTPFERFWLILATRLFCKSSDLVVTPSRGTWEDLVRNYGAPISKGRVIPNFVELSLGSENTSLPPLPARPRICWVGRLDRERNVEELVKAFTRLSRSTSGSLIIVGDGPQRKIIEDLVEAESLGSRVFFAGFREDVFPFLRASDIFVHTCLFDGCPNSLLEACAAGLPVIAQNCPYGPAEILDGGKYGLLVNSQKDLEFALKELLTDVDLRRRFSLLARERASHYSAEKTISGYELVINEVIEGCNH